MIAETQRLYLREITHDDAQTAYDLNLDPDVIKYTGDEPFKNVGEAENFLRNYDHYRKYGFGRWGVIDKSTKDFLGWCGLKYTPKLDEHDVGFRFFKKHWNKGYATESARKCLELGFTKFGMKTIVGRAMTENKASIRVLERIGLSLWKKDNSDDEDEVIYKIDKSDFEKQ